MRIGDLMTSEVPKVDPAETIRDAARRMAEARVQALPVCQGDRITGILTDWDVTRAVAQDDDASRHPVSDYMTTDLVAAAPDADVDEASERMADRRIHHLVVCEGDRFEGLIHVDVEWSQLGGYETPSASFTAPI